MLRPQPNSKVALKINNFQYFILNKVEEKERHQQCKSQKMFVCFFKSGGFTINKRSTTTIYWINMLSEKVYKRKRISNIESTIDIDEIFYLCTCKISKYMYDYKKVHP